jgi:isopenicillin N synthase-like dioxygenase
MTAPPATAFAVPVIDIGLFESGSADERRAVAKATDRAATGVGFMQVVGHGIPPEVIAGLTAAMDAFFSMDDEAKLSYRPPSVEINRGYSGPLSERLSYSLGVGSAADLFEAFNVGTPASRYPQLALSPKQYAENIWPDDAFRAQVEAWFDHAARLARRMTTLFAVALGLPDDWFGAYQDHSIDVLRMNHYRMPAGRVTLDDAQLGMGAHTDFGIVTILWADPVLPGLQILDPKGMWHDVVPAPGALLVNLGDLLARWTNDRWLSTMHRVLPPIDRHGRVVRRRSAAFFHDGNADAVVTFLPGCAATPADVLYPPITIGDHIAAKLAGSRGLELNTAAQREAARLHGT